MACAMDTNCLCARAHFFTTSTACIPTTIEETRSSTTATIGKRWPVCHRPHAAWETGKSFKSVLDWTSSSNFKSTRSNSSCCGLTLPGSNHSTSTGSTLSTCQCESIESWPTATVSPTTTNVREAEKERYLWIGRQLDLGYGLDLKR